MNERPLTRHALDEGRGGLLEYVSPSRLNLWLRCPLAFRLKYVDGVPRPTSEGLFLGKMVHRLLEHYYRKRQLGITLDPAALLGCLETLWDQAVEGEDVAFDASAHAQAVKRQAAGLVRAYLAQLPQDEPPPLAVERLMEAPLVDPVTGRALEVPLVGIVDLVSEAREGPVIVDFKTAARSTAPLEISHEIQLTSYAWLFQHEFARPESALEIRTLAKTKVPQVHVHRYGARTEAHFRRLVAAVCAYLDDVDRGQFCFRPGLGCSFCDYREDHCRRWAGTP